MLATKACMSLGLNDDEWKKFVSSLGCLQKALNMLEPDGITANVHLPQKEPTHSFTTPACFVPPHHSPLPPPSPYPCPSLNPFTASSINNNNPNNAQPLPTSVLLSHALQQPRMLPKLLPRVSQPPQMMCHNNIHPVAHQHASLMPSSRAPPPIPQQIERCHGKDKVEEKLHNRKPTKMEPGTTRCCVHCGTSKSSQWRRLAAAFTHGIQASSIST